MREADVVLDQNDVADTAAVAGRIKALLGTILGDPALAATIDENTSIVNDLGLDSIQMINFLLQLEDEFNLELDFEDLSLEQLDSLRQLTAFVSEAGAR
ncbi:acyl carrier protein [Goodfellowiella coeruleoviolacea]|uniref:Acyl carrier protein n=1 Tax=Goodfellowiella coeruleoviolacea TaxID=334858 RepID=A0AAE3G7U8_9PSEU|nr:phosphopantetheine-binding protein [Goodfellowiella coeruleoviolacea]MCP2163165.1 acyl carrier protein [Goodfellowiella coeruleoviolacea]